MGSMILWERIGSLSLYNNEVNIEENSLERSCLKPIKRSADLSFQRILILPARILPKCVYDTTHE